MVSGMPTILLVAVVMCLLPAGTVPAVDAQAGALIELNTRYDQQVTFAKEKRESSRRHSEETGDLHKEQMDAYESNDFDELSIRHARWLSELNSTADLLAALDPDSIDSRIFMDGGEYTGRDIGVRPDPAKCEPDLQLVELKLENLNESRFYSYPTCTRVKRCSGCCHTKQLVCEPVVNRPILFSVNVIEYQPRNKDRFSHRDIVTVEEHVKCKCQCRIKEQHCNERQVYNPNNCRCECTNKDERDQCAKERDLKQWNPDTCNCECLPRNEECTSGSHYDRSACKCVPNEFYAHEEIASYWSNLKPQQEQQEQQQQLQQRRPIPLVG